MYKIIFDINADNDFTFEGEDIIEEYYNEFDDAFERLIEKMDLLCKTMTENKIGKKCKTSIVNIIHNKIKELHSGNRKEFFTDFEYGNYSGYFGMEKVYEEVHENGVIYKKCK